MEIKKMTDDEYFAYSGVNSSLIKEIYSDPELYIYNKRKGIKRESKSMRIGSLVHCLFLEPDEYDKRYLAVSSSAATKIYKDAVKENPDKLVITNPEQELAFEIVEYNRQIADIFAPTANEQAVVGDIYFKSSEKNIPVKGKIDAVGFDGDKFTIYDLKTTSDLEWFDRDAIKYGYHIQAGFYRWITGEALKGKIFYNYVIVAVETKPPYKAKLFEATPRFISVGRQIAYETILNYFVDQDGTLENYQRPPMEYNRLRYNQDDETFGATIRRERLSRLLPLY